MIPYGKSIYFWHPDNFPSWTPEAMAGYTVALDVESVALKLANGNSLYGDRGRLVDAFGAQGLRVGGWQYYYSGVRFISPTSSEYRLTGITPENEVEYSKLAIEQYNPAYWIIDAEREFKVNGQADRAKRLMLALMPFCHARNIPVGLSSYRFPEVHREFPWYEFATVAGGVDFQYPQVYWNKPALGFPGYGPLVELDKSYWQYRDMYASWKIPLPPYIPVGRAYVGDGYAVPGPSAAEITIFMNEAVKQQLAGFSFWNVDSLHRHEGGAERYAAISQYKWPGTNPPPPVPIPTTTYFLITRSPDRTNLRGEPSIAQGNKSIVGSTFLGAKLELLESKTQPDGYTWYKVASWVRGDGGKPVNG